MRVRRFYDLMPHRIREVLLVSSPYDAFILEEDGLLTEETYREYRALSLHSFPRFTHVPTGEAAIRRLKERRFDLILVMTSLADMGINALGRMVKKIRPGRPVVFLALDGKELVEARSKIDPRYIDGSFLWSGDSKILLAIIQFVEDRENVDHDLVHGNVRVIIMLEDSPRYYSPFLGILYKELMTHSQSLYHEGANELHRRMYMKSRPKILLATSYEQGVELFRKYQRNVIAVISDVRIPRNGSPDPTGGLHFARLTRRAIPELPLLLQTAEDDIAEEANKIRAFFVNKRSPTLLEEIRRFLTETLGFGDFVFRCHADGPEVARARDVKELRKKLASIPDDSIAYHANHNHFSIWLMARSEFETAEALRPTTVEDFGNVDGLREALVELLRDIHLTSHRGTISDFSTEHFGHELFSRLGTGSLGGKARGIAFLNRTLANLPPAEFGGLTVRFPKTTVITSEHFDTFVGRNQLRDFAYESVDDREIAARFVAHPLPEPLRRDLAVVIEQMHGPLAVRSSSLLEDSLHQPFAGIYTTLMLANRARDPKVRLRELCAAVKLVYASTFYSDAKSYLASTGHRVEEEKMAVIIQDLVGRRHRDRFYPHFSGVAESYNFYPIGSQKPEEGVVHVALGLGRFVVDGGLSMRFNPYHPGVLPPFRSQKALLDNTQRFFYALDLRHPCEDLTKDLFSNVRRFDLRVAENDGTLFPVGSVYRRDDRRVRDDLSLQGPRVVTFNNILKHRAIPLPTALCRILEIASEGLAGPVEIEFACDMGDWGRRLRRRQRRQLPRLYILQMRPFAAMSKANGAVEETYARDDCLCVSKSSLGHGVIDDLCDLIYVRRDGWQASHNKKIAAEVARFNKRLTREGRPYVLIGPGRWGTADEWLGIPVKWSQISNVKVMVEASPDGYDVEPSQGTHFFQNITSLRIGYLTLPSGADKNNGNHEEFFDWDWLDAQDAVKETAHLRHVRLGKPLRVVLNGRVKTGLIAYSGARAE